MMGFKGQYTAHRVVQMKLLLREGVRSDQRVLEIGCGPLTLGIPLIAYLQPGGYTGLDVRPAVVREAQALVQRHGLECKKPRIVASNDFGINQFPGEKFDVMVAFSVLYHLEDHLVAALLKQASRRLTQGSRLYANINQIHEPSRWLEFPFVRRSVKFYSRLAADVGLAVVELGSGHELGIPPDDIAGRNVYLALTKSAPSSKESH